MKQSYSEERRQRNRESAKKTRLRKKHELLELQYQNEELLKILHENNLEKEIKSVNVSYDLVYENTKLRNEVRELKSKINQITKYYIESRSELKRMNKNKEMNLEVISELGKQLHYATQDQSTQTDGLSQSTQTENSCTTCKPIIKNLDLLSGVLRHQGLGESDIFL